MPLRARSSKQIIKIRKTSMARIMIHYQPIVIIFVQHNVYRIRYCSYKFTFTFYLLTATQILNIFMNVLKRHLSSSYILKLKKSSEK